MEKVKKAFEERPRRMAELTTPGGWSGNPGSREKKKQHAGHEGRLWGTCQRVRKAVASALALVTCMAWPPVPSTMLAAERLVEEGGYCLELLSTCLWL